ncbi:DUF1667 domain-containing protein [Fusobacterium sp. PH5-44]|uniref:DUF1667 domain-containing protein n=1 Tax=unclassified Fusobacterium TaxID=2648384 RepID=UPI003D1C6C6F
MLKEYTCIICPNSCDIEVLFENNKVASVEGALCPRGKTYIDNELSNPVRNIATSVKIENGQLPLASVKLSHSIPKEKIFDVMNEIKKIKINAPVQIGQVVIKNVLGLDSDVIITKNIGIK